jgi:large subunit ribosomal protein L10
MARADKEIAVADLAERFRSSAGAVLTEYRGLTVSQLGELRQSLGANAQFSVVKNTLTKIAATQAGVSADVIDLLEGPSAIAFVHGDAVEAARGLRDFARTYPQLVLKGGLLEGKPLKPDEIIKLADLEPREVLLAKLAGAMKASLAGAAATFNALPAQMARLLGALEDKRGSEAGTASPAAAGPGPEAGAEAADDGAAATDTAAAASADDTAATADADD